MPTCTYQFGSEARWVDCTEDRITLWETFPSTAIPSFIIKSQRSGGCIRPRSQRSGSQLYATVHCDPSYDLLWFSKIQQAGTGKFVLQHVKSGLCVQTVSGVPKLSTRCTLQESASDGPTEQFPVVKGKFLLYHPRTASALGAYTSTIDTTADKPKWYQTLRFGGTNPLDKNVHFEKSGGSEGKFRIYLHTESRRRSNWYFASSRLSTSRRRLSKKDLTLWKGKSQDFRKIFVGGGGLFLLQHVKTKKCLDLQSKDGNARFVSDCKEHHPWWFTMVAQAFRMLPANAPHAGWVARMLQVVRRRSWVGNLLPAPPTA